MAIVFTEQQKRQKYLVFVFIFIVFITLIVFWKGFFAKPSLREAELFSTSTPILPVAEVTAPSKSVLPEIKIDFSLFSNPFFEQIQEFPVIPSFQATTDYQLGRENPFIKPEE